MNVSEGRVGVGRRVDPESVARLLPGVMVAYGHPAPRVAVAALIAGIGDVAIESTETSEEALEVIVNLVGSEYLQGFIEGFECSVNRREKPLRFVQGLEDAANARQLLRTFPWASRLLAEIRP